ncbi:MAG: DUF3883 domain-containing protein [Campylobacterales bacterium]
MTDTSNQKALLVTWTEDAWPAEAVTHLKALFDRDGFVVEDWRVKEFRKTHIGMPVIAYKQKDRGRGIFGIGYVNSVPSKPSYSEEGRMLPHRSVEICFTTLCDPLTEEGPLVGDTQSVEILGGTTSSRYSGVLIDIEQYEKIVSAALRSRPNVKTPFMLESSGPNGKPDMSRFSPSKTQQNGKYESDPESDIAMKELGRLGEAFVYNTEKQKLITMGRSDLSRRVRWVSEEDGDGFGYDILSYDGSGGELYIEVKTTAGARNSPFYITANEVQASIEHGSRYRLVRVFNLHSAPSFFVVNGPITEQTPGLVLMPTEYRVQVGDF